MRVLVADDSAMLRGRVAALVSAVPGGAVVEASDATQAVTALGSERFDVIILDVRMPGGGGLRVLDAIAALAPRPLVIVYTSHPTPEHREAFAARGVTHFLDKARDVAELDRLLREAAGRA
jgi:DNA-binding NarL/FixJ family response regulator